MAYEYENKINEAFFIAGRDGRNVNIELLVELQQVYNKAKAWDSLKELLMKEYPSVVHLADVSNGDDERGQLSKHEEVLKHMDFLDGTNEFSNLLSDLEDE